jgi:uncharacterized protein (DUF58 family)
LTVGVGFGAINTGNNLLFLLLGMMLSMIVGSGVLSEAVLRELAATRRLPNRLTAGTAAPGEFVVENPKGYPSLSIQVEDPVARGMLGPARGQTVGFEPIAWWKVWKSPGEDDRPVADGYTLRIGPGESANVEARWTFSERGRYRIPRLAVRTRFPFGLFDKSREIDSEATVTVFPEPLDASDWARTVTASFGDVETNRRGRGDEYYGLRDHKPEDDSRRVHWKVSARRGKLVVREDEERAQRSVEVALAHMPPGQPSAEALDEFERYVRRTAGLVSLLAQEGYRVGLRLADVVVEPNVGGRHIDRILSHLAVVEWVDRLPPVDDDEPVGRIVVGPAEAVAAWGLRADLVLDDAGDEP